jgi:dual specificity protein kinase YAK1
MLEQGKQVSHFFNVVYDEYGRKQWRLKSLEEYEREHPSAKEQPSKKFFAANTLPEIIKSYPNQRKGFKQSDIDRGKFILFSTTISLTANPDHPFSLEMQNRVSFIDFVQGLLNMNPMERWTPQQARQHPFVINELLRAPYVPPMGPTSSRVSAVASGQQAALTNNVTAERPYGGLPPTPARASAKQYQDAASYQQHLNQQQAHVAAASASAYRQAQYSHNPYAPQQAQVQSPNHPTSFSQQQQQGQQPFAPPRLPATTAPTVQAQQRVQQPPAIVHHSPSSSMGSLNYSNTAMRNSSSGPLSPIIPTNPPAAHAYSSRNRSGTFSQLDVPPALQKLGLDLSSYKAIGTPQLRRDDQRAAWERRHGVDASQLDRRRSLKQANPHLEHLEYYAQSGQPGYYYASPPSLSQPFSVVVDPRMQDSAGSAVTVPPQVYAGAPGTRYAAPPQAMSMQQPPMSGGGGATPYDTFDQYDLRDGLNTMLHQPLVPTSQQHQQRGMNPPVAYFGNPQLQAAAGGMYGQVSPYGGPQSSAMKNADNLLNGDLGSMNQTTGKQRKSDAQVWP